MKRRAIGQIDARRIEVTTGTPAMLPVVTAQEQPKSTWTFLVEGLANGRSFTTTVVGMNEREAESYAISLYKDAGGQ